MSTASAVRGGKGSIFDVQRYRGTTELPIQGRSLWRRFVDSLRRLVAVRPTAQ